MSWLELKVSPVTLALLLAIAMWWLARQTAPSLPQGPLVLTLAALLAALALLLGGAAVLHFRKARTTVNPFRPQQISALVADGVFRWSRNPMYLALLLALLAWALYLADLWAMLLVLVFPLWMNRFQIRPEERALREAFGDEFDAYCRRVRRWI
jgi:protein-S-isoprenylcysteine O-methyltransferase Ste14